LPRTGQTSDKIRPKRLVQASRMNQQNSKSEKFR
jgi:hypothetical protein